MKESKEEVDNLNKKLAVLSEDERKEEIKDLNEKLSELNEEELAQAVGGGISPSINTF